MFWGFKIRDHRQEYVAYPLLSLSKQWNFLLPPRRVNFGHFSFCKGQEDSHPHYSQKHLIAVLLAVRSWMSTHIFKTSVHSVLSNVMRAWKCLSWGPIIVIILNKAKEVPMLKVVGELNCISYWIVKNAERMIWITWKQMPNIHTGHSKITHCNQWT